MRSLILEVRSRRPSPRQALQGLSMTRPAPWQCGTGLGDAEDAARVDDLAAAAAGRAGPDAGAGFGARAVAGVAAFRLGDRDLLFAAVGGFLEGDLHVVAQVVAALRLAGVGRGRRRRGRRRCCPPPKTSRKISNGSWKPPPRPNPPGPAVKGGMAVLVVGGALLRVAQDFVGLAQFLELLLGGFVARVLVRVILDRELAVGLLDFLVGPRFARRRGLRNNRVWPWDGSGGGLLGHDHAGRAESRSRSL